MIKNVVAESETEMLKIWFKNVCRFRSQTCPVYLFCVYCNVNYSSKYCDGAMRSVAGNFVNKTAISVILFTELPVRRKWKVVLTVLTVPQPQT